MKNAPLRRASELEHGKNIGAVIALPRPAPRPLSPVGLDLTGQNSNDSGGSGGAGRASTPHLRPTPSPTGSSGSRSMSPAVGEC
ncbi:unnamed protein product [Euphydryas editha]|uniref:Uncharacterized protein n=1 Tax=Euphydryas editha TaxID=104508 RepID=A0AAU9UBZ6_EUPED|nr:unnamed protein product [Euphydryas editha]